MRKNGTHETGAIGARRMNDQLIRKMNEDLDHGWKALAEHLVQAARLLRHELEGQVATTGRSMRGKRTAAQPRATVANTL